MKDESRNKNKFVKVISKNRLVFAFVGSVVAIIAFFVPTFHLDWYNMDFREIGNLWIFGLNEWELETIYSHFGWFNIADEEQFGLALVSLISTIVMSLLVLGTITIASITLIRKRKKGEFSSRLILYFSVGLFVATSVYTFAISLLRGHQPSHWFCYAESGRMGTLLFIIGSVLILFGYTVKIKPLLKILSLFGAGVFLYFGTYNLTSFIYILIVWGTPFVPEAVLFQFNRLVVPAIITLLCALAIVVINFILYRRAKKKTKMMENERGNTHQEENF